MGTAATTEGCATLPLAAHKPFGSGPCKSQDTFALEDAHTHGPCDNALDICCSLFHLSFSKAASLCFLLPFFRSILTSLADMLLQPCCLQFLKKNLARALPPLKSGSAACVRMEWQGMLPPSPPLTLPLVLDCLLHCPAARRQPAGACFSCMGASRGQQAPGSLGCRLAGGVVAGQRVRPAEPAQAKLHLKTSFRQLLWSSPSLALNPNSTPHAPHMPPPQPPSSLQRPRPAAPPAGSPLLTAGWHRRVARSGQSPPPGSASAGPPP